jgi:hypothetical protein
MHKKRLQKNSDFYTPSGIHVYFKDEIINDVDAEVVISKVESKIPLHLLSEIEMIIVGWFDEFEKRSVNAFYDSGTVYITNMQDSEEDMFDDIIHEISHSLEEAHGYFIYGDEKVKDEFLKKRAFLHDLLWKLDYKVPKSLFGDVEFNTEFDDFLHKKIGYSKLSPICQGLFVNAYAATSLREYFATMFTEFYLDSDHSYLKKLCPILYKKIFLLQDPNKLDNEY